MMKYFLLTSFLLAGLGSFAQEATPTYDDYMEKSKRQRSAAAILLGGGTAGLLLTATADLANALGDGLTTSIFPYAETNEKSFAAFYLSSLAVIGAGTALLVSSGKNKRKAWALQTSMLIKMENYSLPQLNGFKQQSIPALGVQVNF